MIRAAAFNIFNGEINFSFVTMMKAAVEYQDMGSL